MLGIVASPDIWRFQPHLEVWVLVAGLAAAYAYAIKVIGPRAVRPGQPVVRRRQVGCFVAGLTMLWVASDWPMHDISEEYLYSAHMLQHMMLSYFMPPLMLLATPDVAGPAGHRPGPGVAGVPLAGQARGGRRDLQRLRDGLPRPRRW